MHPNTHKFIVSTIGAQATDAIGRLCKTVDDLDDFIGPRTVLAWINNVLENNSNFKGKLPGFPLSSLKFQKNEDQTINSQININDFYYSFQNQDILHLVSSVILALESEVKPLNKNLPNDKLKELGESLDILTKAKIHFK